MQRFIALAGLVLCCGCGPSGSYTLPVSWLFADGRACQEAEVRVVSLSEKSWAQAFDNRCPVGQAGGSVMVSAIKAGDELTAEGLSATATVLYRGKLTPQDPPPASLTITLDYVGGQ